MKITESEALACGITAVFSTVDDMNILATKARELLKED
jgi:hypothetical protein